MRRTLFLPALVATAVAQGQWAAPDVNTYIGGGHADVSMIANGPDGSTYVSWFENSTGPYKVRMQRVDVNGIPQWAVNGLVISEEAQGTSLSRHDFGADNSGNALFTFQDQPGGGADVLAYKVGPDGTNLWGASGVRLETPGGSGAGPRIAALNDDRVVVAWNGQTSPATAMVQVLSAEGVAIWDEPMGMTTSGASGRPLIIPNADGGFWLTYVHQTGNFLSPGTIRAKRFGTDLTEGPEIIVSDKTIADFFFPEAVSDGLNGFYMGFNTGNAASPNMTDVYVQRVRANGTVWSISGTAVEEGAATHRFNTGAQPTLTASGDTLVMAYRVTNSSQGLAGLSIQAFDTSGTALNGPQGVVVHGMSDRMFSPFGTFMMPQGLLVGYSTTAGFNNDRMDAVHVNANGSVGAAGGIELATDGPSGKNRGAMLAARTDVAVVCFVDGRNDGEVYLQGIDLRTPMAVAEQELIPVTLLHGERPELLFGEATRGDVRMVVLDLQGRRIDDRRLGARSAGDRVLLDLDGAASGVYSILLECGGQHTVLRLVR